MKNASTDVGIVTREQTINPMNVGKSSHGSKRKGRRRMRQVMREMAKETGADPTIKRIDSHSPQLREGGHLQRQ